MCRLSVAAGKSSLTAYTPRFVRRRPLVYRSSVFLQLILVSFVYGQTVGFFLAVLIYSFTRAPFPITLLHLVWPLVSSGP